MKKKILYMILSITFCFTYASAVNNENNINQTKILKSAPKLNPKALSYAVKGYNWAEAKGQVKNNKILTIVDFSLPSDQKRLWLVNLNTNKVILNSYTTHGKNSGFKNAIKFSNRDDTEKSSIGVFKIVDPYIGHHGLSLHIKGLEKGINDNAAKRDIVIHPAYYASEKFVKANHRAGRRWGCFALDPSLSKKFINLTKNGSIMVAYAKESNNDPYLS